MHQLTPWSNDPVQDPAFEHYLLQDLDSRELLPLTPAGRGGAAAQAPRAPRPGLHGVRVPAPQHGARDHLLRRPRRAHQAGARAACANDGIGTRRLRALGDGRVAARRGARRTPHRPHLEAARTCRAVFGQQREIERAASAAAPPSSRSPALRRRRPHWTCDRREFFAARGAHRGARHAGPARRQRPRPLRRAGRRAHARRRRGQRPFAFCSGRPTTAKPRCSWRAAGSSATCAEALAAGARLLGRAARPPAGAHARPAVRRDGQPLAALPDARRAGSGRRPASTRPAAPSAFATSCRTRWPSRWPIPTRLREQILRQRVAPVPRGRRAALVARARRRRRAHAFLRRPAVAAAMPARTTSRSRGDAARARRGRALHRRRRRSPTAPRTPTTRRRPAAQTATRVRALRAHDRPQPARSARTACR